MFQRFLLTTAAAVALISGPALAAQDAIRLGMVLEPPGLDPTANAAAAIDEITYANLFEGLTRFAPDGSIAPDEEEDEKPSDEQAPPALPTPTQAPQPAQPVEMPPAPTVAHCRPNWCTRLRTDPVWWPSRTPSPTSRPPTS